MTFSLFKLLRQLGVVFFFVTAASLCGDTPTETPTETASETASPTPSETPSETATEWVSETFSPTETPVLPDTQTSTATPSPSPSRTATATPLVNPAGCPKVVWVYYPYWYNSYNAAQIPYDKVTHIAHAFVKPIQQGALQVPSGYLEPALITNAHAAGVKVIMSLGGADDGPGGDSEYFKGIMANPVSRTALVTNIEYFLRTNQYDGVDIDWEYPSNGNDRTRLNAFVAELRAAFNASVDPHGPNWIISGALSCDQYYGQWWDVATLKAYMNYFNIMVYDIFGSWTNVSGHESPLFKSTLPGASAYNSNGKAALDYYMGRGVSGAQLLYGLPQYGKRFDTENLYDACPGGCGSSIDLKYNQIAPLIGAGWTRQFDASAQSVYLTKDAGAQVITYDDPETIRIKSDYANWARGCAGVFSWDLSEDYMGPGDQPLVQQMWESSNYCNITPTFSRTPTPQLSMTPTPTPSPQAPGGDGRVEAASPLPNPNPARLLVKLDGPADGLRLEIYSTAMRVLADEISGPYAGGWQDLPLPAACRSIPNGLYYYRVLAHNGVSDQGRALIGKFFILR